MATYVLCHGAWAGGWQWREVANWLRAAGHEVYTPTFTGLGERVHLAQPEIDLETHIQDVLGVLQFEDLHQVILLGYSYSGLVITAVADRVPERLKHLVYLDAFVPEGGQSLGDILGSEITAEIKAAAEAYGEGWRVPHNPPDAPHRVDQPLKSLLQPVVVKNTAGAHIPHTFIYCAEGEREIGPLHGFIAQAAQKARAAGWQYHELQTGHLPMETVPEDLADLLHKLAR